MIINYLDFKDAALFPYQADSPPGVDSDTILPQASSLKNFQAVSRRTPQVIKEVRPIEQARFAQAEALNLQR
jgi:hypothetical protein